jgi:hypothetical protein
MEVVIDPVVGFAVTFRKKLFNYCMKACCKMVLRVDKG